MRLLPLLLFAIGLCNAQFVPSKLLSYLCRSSDQDICMGVSAGGKVVERELTMRTKPRIENEATGLDYFKLRYDVSYETGIIAMSANSAYAVQGRANGEMWLELRNNTKGTFEWNLSPFQNYTGAAKLVHRTTGKCATIMHCEKIPVIRGNRPSFYCAYWPSKASMVRPGEPPFPPGSPFRLWPCKDSLNANQNFVQELDCSPGCSPAMRDNDRCDVECMTPACLFDRDHCTPFPTMSPTPPTHSPTAVPSSEPTRAPSLVPSATPTKNPSLVPSATPSVSPVTSVPSVRPSFRPSAGPSTTPSAGPSTSPSRTPSAGPSATPSRAPSRTPSAAPSANATNATLFAMATDRVFRWDLILLILLLLICLPCCFFAARRRREKQKEEKLFTIQPPSPVTKAHEDLPVLVHSPPPGVSAVSTRTYVELHPPLPVPALRLPAQQDETPRDDDWFDLLVHQRAQTLRVKPLARGASTGESRPASFEVLIGSQFDSVEGIVAGIEAGEGTAIIGERNRHALEVLEREKKRMIAFRKTMSELKR